MMLSRSVARILSPPMRSLEFCFIENGGRQWDYSVMARGDEAEKSIMAVVLRDLEGTPEIHNDTETGLHHPRIDDVALQFDLARDGHTLPNRTGPNRLWMDALGLARILLTGRRRGPRSNPPARRPHLDDVTFVSAIPSTSSAHARSGWMARISVATTGPTAGGHNSPLSRSGPPTDSLKRCYNGSIASRHAAGIGYERSVSGS